MAICCRIDDRQIHRRLRHMGAPTKTVGSWPDSVTAQDPKAESQELPGIFSRNEQGLGASKAFADWQSRQLPYLAQVSSRFPLIHSGQFGPLPLPPSCHQGRILA